MIAPYTALDEALSRVSQQISESRSSIQPSKPPELLFHYTNTSGLLGILESTRLWATNYRYLNDSSEIGYGVSLFDSLVSERAAKIENEILAEFLRRTRVTVNVFDGMYDFYVACFCERDDLLNQWRVYAGSGGGFALGLKAREIDERNRPQLESQHQFFLRKVLYDEAKQHDLMAQLLEATAGVLATGSTGMSIEESNNLIARCCRFVSAEAAEYFICFKHPAFEVEQEWRLCYVPGPRDEPKVLFRHGQYGLTPYVSLDPSSAAGVFRNKLPLSRVTHGPTTDSANIRHALNQLLRVKGYIPHTEITGSTLPVRLGV
jgi:hypothetical protein